MCPIDAQGTLLLFEKGPKIDKTLSVKHLGSKEQVFVKKKFWDLRGPKKRGFFMGGYLGLQFSRRGHENFKK